MKIAMVCPIYDPALAAERLYRAINKHTEHSCRLVVGRPSILKDEEGEDFEFNQTKDIVLVGACEVEEAEKMLKEVDVIHFHDADWTFRNPGPVGINWRTVLPGKKIVWHGHGGWWLMDPKKKIESCRKANASMVTCSALDTVIVPELRWMPNVVEVSNIKVADREWGGRINVGMAVFKSVQLYKGVGVWTEYIFDWILNKERFEFHVIAGARNEECLRRRAGDHICIDNITQGFHGLAGLEGLAMGQAVVVRLDPMVKKAWGERFPGLPMIDVVGMDHAASWFTKLEKDRSLLKDIALSGRDWMDKNFTEKQIAEEWIEYYQSLGNAPSGKTNISVKSPTIREMFDGASVQEHPIDGMTGTREENDREIAETLGVLNQLQPGPRAWLLDAGCGTGRLFPTFKTMGYQRVTGVDFSPGMLDTARKEFPGHELVDADLLDLSMFDDNSFQVTLLMYVLTYIVPEEDMRQVIAEVERVTAHDIIIGQVMEAEHKVETSRCKTWEVYELLKFFKRKRLNKFYKHAFDVKAIGEDGLQPVSFVQMSEANEIDTETLLGDDII